MTASELTSLVRAAPGASAVTLAVARDGAHDVYCHGHLSYGGLPNTPDSAYEIGSVTKTFTALLLAELAAQNRVGLHDPIDAHLPPAHRPTPPAGTRITLLHLATHTSGLPRLPPGLLTRALPTYSTNPYAHYRTEHFHHALQRTRTRRRPGSRLTYSNYGMALLGHAPPWPKPSARTTPPSWPSSSAAPSASPPPPAAPPPPRPPATAGGGPCRPSPSPRSPRPAPCAPPALTCCATSKPTSSPPPLPWPQHCIASSSPACAPHAPKTASAWPGTCERQAAGPSSSTPGPPEASPHSSASAPRPAPPSPPSPIPAPTPAAASSRRPTCR